MKEIDRVLKYLVNRMMINLLIWVIFYVLLIAMGVRGTWAIRISEMSTHSFFYKGVALNLNVGMYFYMGDVLGSMWD